MKLSVVIASYNDGPLIADTVEPLLADPATGEVIVVFDGSSDGSYELLQRRAAGEPRLRPFWIENRGRSGAVQYGIDRARHEILLLLDSDVVASPSLVSGHARRHEDGRPRLVIGYMPITPGTRRPGSFIAERYAEAYEERCHHFERDPREMLRGFWAGNLSLPRQALLDAGGFDAGLGLRYNDDLELGLRLAGAGLEPVFDRRLLAEHRFTRSLDGFRSVSRAYGRDMIRIAVRYPGQVWLPPPPPSRPAAALRRRLVRPRAFRAVSGAVYRSTQWAGRARLWPVERRLGLLLERLEVERGMHEAGAALGLRDPYQVPRRDVDAPPGG